MTYRLSALLALPLLLAACAATSTPETPAPSRVYMALGTEPGWTLEITPERLNYAGDYGETIIRVANPGARPSPGGERYAADRLTVDVRRAECSDGMSDRRYRDTVTVTADGKTVTGCGGPVLPPADLTGTSWTFVSIDDVPVTADRPTSLIFDAERMSGSAGCNRFGGSYAIKDGLLTAGPMVATLMACPDPAMAQEGVFLDMLKTPVGITFPSDGTMVLTGAGGKTAVLKRVI